MNMNDLYKPAEAAKLIGIGYATIYRWINTGRLIPVKLAGHTLIPKSEIDRIKRNRGKKTTEALQKYFFGLIRKSQDT